MCLFINLDYLGLGLAYECTSWDMSFHKDITAWTYMALLESTMKILIAVEFINNSIKLIEILGFDIYSLMCSHRCG